MSASGRSALLSVFAALAAACSVKLTTGDSSGTAPEETHSAREGAAAFGSTVDRGACNGVCPEGFRCVARQAGEFSTFECVASQADGAVDAGLESPEEKDKTPGTSTDEEEAGRPSVIGEETPHTDASANDPSPPPPPPPPPPVDPPPTDAGSEAGDAPRPTIACPETQVSCVDARCSLGNKFFVETLANGSFALDTKTPVVLGTPDGFEVTIRHNGKPLDPAQTLGRCRFDGVATACTPAVSFGPIGDRNEHLLEMELTEVTTGLTCTTSILVVAFPIPTSAPQLPTWEGSYLLESPGPWQINVSAA